MADKVIGAKKGVTATIDIAWLKYDIMNETFLRGRTIQNKENHKEVASLFASEDEENYEKLLRSIAKAFAEIKTELAEYLNENQTEVSSAKRIDGTQDLVLNLSLPSNFNEAASSGIAEAAHDYIKNSVIAEWYLVTNKQEANDYFTLAQKSMLAIRESVSKRSRPNRPTTEP